MTSYALFENGNQISKAHPYKMAALIEAYERKIMIEGRMGKHGKYIQCLPKEYEIKEINNGN